METLQGRGRLQPRAILLLTLLPLVGSVACYRTRAYRGDGKIIAVKVGNFFLNCTWYKVSLGPIDLTRKNRRSFVMQGLPHEEMVLGIKITLSDLAANIEKNKSDALVKVELVDEVGRVAIQQQARLDEWTWELGGDLYKSFVYRRGDAEREGPQVLKGDQGRGTYFKPRTNAKYTLTVDVIEPDANSRSHSAELEITNLCG